MRRIGLVLVSFLILINIQAQSNSSAVGIRLAVDEGGYIGFTYKYSLNSDSKLEGILQFSDNTITINGLYEKYRKFPNVPNLDWFYGGGAFLGFGTNVVYGGVKVF